MRRAGAIPDAAQCISATAMTNSGGCDNSFGNHCQKRPVSIRVAWKVQGLKEYEYELWIWRVPATGRYCFRQCAFRCAEGGNTASLEACRTTACAVRAGGGTRSLPESNHRTGCRVDGYRLIDRQASYV